MLLRFALLCAYTALMFILSTFVLFLATESSESVRTLLNLHAIRYFDFMNRYEFDPQLVFVTRFREMSFQSETKGDIYSPEYNIDVNNIQFNGWYNRHGFRSTIPDEKTDIVIIGDSFIEIGENDLDLLNERVAHETGLTTVNLGRGWYGPYQYLELLRRYGLSSNPACALFSFFSGNDIRDISEYRTWSTGGWYYNWRPMRQSFLKRYSLAGADTLTLMRRRIGELRRQSKTPATLTRETIHSELGIVDLAGNNIAMAFAYRHMGLPPEEAVASEEWRILKSIVKEFQDEAVRHGITTVIVFIPTKLEVYAPFLTEHSGASVLRDVKRNERQRI
jgi:hypothetical protein